jgi:hypothetical protein
MQALHSDKGAKNLQPLHVIHVVQWIYISALDVKPFHAGEEREKLATHLQQKRDFPIERVAPYTDP